MSKPSTIKYCKEYDEYKVIVEGSTCYEYDEQAAKDTFKAMTGGATWPDDKKFGKGNPDNW
jgi:hypothetical protein